MLNEEGVKPELIADGEVRINTNICYLDNGASNHMIGHPRKFKELDENVTDQVKFGDGSTVQIMGKGSLLFQCTNGDQRLLSEVYHIPRLSNIISLGQMTEAGNKVVMDGQFLRIFDQNESLLMKVRRSMNHLYKIALITTKPVCLLVGLRDPAWLWHTRLGHVNSYALKMLSEKQMAIGVPKIIHPDQLYEGCLVAKQTRLPFLAQANYRADKPLQLVHVDPPITP